MDKAADQELQKKQPEFQDAELCTSIGPTDKCDYQVLAFGGILGMLQFALNIRPFLAIISLDKGAFLCSYDISI
jgi:hypothetical protein